MAEINLPSGTTSNPASLSGNASKSIGVVTRLNNELAKMLGMTDKIAKNMGFAGGTGSGNITTSGTFSNLGANPQGGMGTLTGLGSTIARVGTFLAGGASAAATAMPGVQDVLSNQLLTSQARFSGFQGNVGATLQSAMRNGTSNSAYDAIQAVSQGTAGGILPGLPGYGGIFNGVTQISNLTGSFGSAMSATTALNQAQTVNKLRMFGINVRNQQGVMRNPADIFKEVYAFANRNAGKTLSRQEVAIGLQSGNGLSNFLDNIAGGDQSLRSALQTSAVQFSQGGNLSRESTTATGQTTAASNASSNLNASKYGLSNAAAPAMSAGYIEGADLLAKFNDGLSNIVSSSKLANDALKQLAKVETLAADQLGQAGLSLVALLGGAMAGGGLFGKLGGSGAVGTIAKGVGRIGNAGIIGLAGNTVGSLISNGAQKGSGQSRMGSAVSLGATGASIGMLFGGPVGALIGGSIGALGGLGFGASTQTSASSSGSATSIKNSGSAGTMAAVIAGTQLGVPYSWGGGTNSGPSSGIGRGANTVGFDCSSFVRFVMSKLGVALPRTAHDQQKVGAQISPKDAQPGDLLFWGNPAHHVALYVGNGMMIQAPQTGGNVERVSVDLNGVTSCSRVINGATGTAELTNLLDIAGSASAGGNDLFGLGGVGANTVSTSNLKGVTAASAMSGGVVSGSGLGMGSSSNNSSALGGMARQYMYINHKTGKLEESSGTNNGQSVINYGGITVNVDVPKGAKLDEKELAKFIKQELISLDISTRVATK